MPHLLSLTDPARDQLNALEGRFAAKQVKKALGYLEANPRHPSLYTHEFTSLKGARGEKIFEAYAQNKTPGAYRIFWHYGPDIISGKKRTAVITIIAIVAHP